MRGGNLLPESDGKERMAAMNRYRDCEEFLDSKTPKELRERVKELQEEIQQLTQELLCTKRTLRRQRAASPLQYEA